jgi:hypothetical protein
VTAGGPAIQNANETKEYVVDNVHVRDHRSGSNAPIDIAPNPRPANVKELPSTLTHEIGSQVMPVMTACTASIPREARGEKPRLQGEITVAIKDHVVTITSAKMQLRDITGSTDDARSCIEQKATGLTLPAADQDDLPNYTIGIDMPVR